MNNIKIGDKVRFTKEHIFYSGNFYVSSIHPTMLFPYLLVANQNDLGMTLIQLEKKYGTYTKDYDIARLNEIEKGWDK